MPESRIKNSKRNIVSGLIKQTVSIVLPFIIRTIILYTLGAEYQGLSGLFSSILQVLNLTDLGFTSAVIYVLYKPVAEGDEEEICALINYLKIIYRFIGLLILIIGLMLMPFLPSLISGSYPSNINIYLLYLAYLFNAVNSYFLFAYKSALLTAMQRNDLVDHTYTVILTIIRLIQVIVLLYTKNYYYYAFLLPVATISNNVLLEVISKKYFPTIRPVGKIDAARKALINKQVKAIFIGKMGDIARNSFDNIILSSFLGLAAVAVYDNYFYIYSAVYGTMTAIGRALQASVGNSVLKESVQKNYNDFFKLDFIFMWVAGWCSICMFCLYQPFMLLWMKGNTEMILSFPDMLLFCVYFYTINMNNTRNLYIEGNGLYWHCRFWYILEAAGNLCLNVILGYFFGVTGVLSATIFTIVIFNFIARTNVLFRYFFKRSKSDFYMSHIYFIIVTIANGCFTYILCSLITCSQVTGLIMRGMLCFIVPNIFYIVLYVRYKEFRPVLNWIKQL